MGFRRRKGFQRMDNEMKGVLFKNDKGDNEKRPDIKGELTIEGVTYQLAA